MLISKPNGRETLFANVQSRFEHNFHPTLANVVKVVQGVAANYRIEDTSHQIGIEAQPWE
ncbi:hypothetical protein SH467x_002273 [Pirellulaceae bacterium SH467]